MAFSDLILAASRTENQTGRSAPALAVPTMTSLRLFEDEAPLSGKRATTESSFRDHSFLSVESTPPLRVPGMAPSAAFGLSPVDLAFATDSPNGDQAGTTSTINRSPFSPPTHGPLVSFSPRKKLLLSITDYEGARNSPRTPVTPDCFSPSSFECSRVEADEMSIGSPMSPPESPSFDRNRLKRSSSLCDSKVLSEPMLHRTDSVFMFGGHFQLMGSLGKGCFSEVFRGRHHETGVEYAIKRSRRTFRGRGDRATYLKEISSVARLPDHPNIVKYYRAWQEEGHFFVQMELCDGGSLRSYAKAHSPSPAIVCRFMRDVMSGLALIHHRGLIHLDLKPDNILISTSDRQLKIADFGLAVPADEWDDQEGDKVYMAPEVLSEQPETASDIFSCGLMFWELLTKQAPPTSGEAWSRIRETGQLFFPAILLAQLEGTGVKILPDMLMAMVAADPAARPAAQTLKDHPLMEAAQYLENA